MIELTIDSLSFNGGRGVGRHDGMVVFVPNTAPGDRVSVQIVKQHARFLEGEVVALLQPSPARRTPPCPIAEPCGGCCWQHLNYAEQLQQKEQILAASLRKLGAVTMLPFLPAENEFHYRSRIQLQSNGRQFGFFAKRSHDLVPAQECWIADQRLNQKWAELQPKDFKQRVELALASDGSVVVQAGVRVPEAALFSQVHPAQNEVLKKHVVDSVSGQPEWIMDLYAGSGNLTFPLAERFPQATVTAVEFSRASVEQGQRLSPRPIHWLAGDVAKVLKRLPVDTRAGVVVLDPPRLGCDMQVVEQLLRHRPKQILYVSCNPMTFARDSERLQSAYRLRSVQGFDMFPQTEHIELLAIFDRSVF